MLHSNNQHGIKKNKHLTGNQRSKLRELQAARLGISADALLKQRLARMREWQAERELFTNSRCPNCGAYGHSFKWCPFAGDFELQRVVRFRGPNGQWGTELPIQLSTEERKKSRQHFGLISTPIGSNSNTSALTPLDIQRNNA